MAQFVLVRFNEGKKGSAQLIEAGDEDQARLEAIGILMDDRAYTAEFTTGSPEGDEELDDDALHEGIDGDFGEGWMIYPIQSAAEAGPVSPAQVASRLRYTARLIDSSKSPDKQYIERRISSVLKSLR